MRKGERLFQLVNLLRVQQPLTAAVLAERMGVSVRTIYRYMDDLSAGGIPVFGEAGVGYALAPHFELPPLSLTQEETEVLALALQMLTRSVGHDAAAAAASLQAKIDAAMPSRRQPVSTVRSLAAPLTPSQMQHWDRLRAAIAQEQGLLIDYLDVEQRSTRRLIYPLGLFYWGGKWTVGSWCALRASFRDFRLDRIGALIRFAGAPARAAEVTLAAYLQHHSGPTRPTDNTLSVAPAHTTDSVHNRSN